jgi:hypothetical protein
MLVPPCSSISVIDCVLGGLNVFCLVINSNQFKIQEREYYFILMELFGGWLGGI